jgi:hypothetical protein
MRLAQMFPDYPRRAMDLRDLNAGILLMVDKLRDISNRLSSLRSGSTPTDLVTLAMDILRNPSMHPCVSSDSSLNKAEYFDAHCIQLLEDILSATSWNLVNDEENTAILPLALSHLLLIMQDYMRETYDRVGNHLIQDFKTALYKGFALVTGTHLSHCLSQPERLNDRQAVLHKTLINGI